MLRSFSSFSALVMLGILTACGGYEDGSFSRGTPERLLDVSSEVVNLGVRSSTEVDELSQWISRDQPTRAELYCTEGEQFCRESRQVLELYGVPFTFVPSNTQTATLVYERVLARDCDQRFKDELDQWRNENHAAFGCSISGNIVQHVTQKQQFISPNLGDFRDAETAIGGYTRYQQSAGGKISEGGNFSIDSSALDSQ